MAKVTLAQVAEYAHVSRGTVDRVVHNRGNVKPDVEARVREALEDLGYERNKIASALASSKYERRICILYYKEEQVQTYYNLKVEEGIKKGTEELDDFGIKVMKAGLPTGDAEVFCEKMREYANDGVSGFAVRGPEDDRLASCIDEIVCAGIPVVTFNSDIPGSKRCCFVGENLKQSGYVAGNIMARMVRKGEKVLIGYGRQYFYAHHARVDGFIAALREWGFNEDDIVIIRTEQNYERTLRGLQDAFQRQFFKGIYASCEPNRAFGEFLTGARLSDRPFVICHDLDPDTTRYLREGIFDFVIDQDVASQSYRALLLAAGVNKIGDGYDGMNEVFSGHIYNAACLKNIQKETDENKQKADIIISN